MQIKPEFKIGDIVYMVEEQNRNGSPGCGTVHYGDGIGELYKTKKEADAVAKKKNKK